MVPIGELTDLHARLTAAVNARLEEAKAARDNPWIDPLLIMSAKQNGKGAASRFMVTTRPDSVISWCQADLAILTEVARWRHESCADGWYSCSQATEEAGFPIDEACSDDERKGQPCDCGLDRRRAAILHPLATAYGVEVNG